MFALVDCNNFYASCQRVFEPHLIGKPVVILSNNDGCVIARSNEAKALGIPMGAPAFEFKKLFEDNNVFVYSSNYALYGDSNTRKTFTGTWVPGSVMKNTKNEEDIKTWYTTGAEPSPEWTEQLVLLGMQDELTSSNYTEGGFNIRMDLKWTVQYKDLKQFYRYMDDDSASSSTTNLVLPDDIRQVPYTVELVP